MDNHTSHETACNQTEAWSWLYAMQPFYMCAICFLGILGNSFVLVVFLLERRRTSVADIYLGNLALADLLMLSCLPFWIVTIFNEFHWTFGCTWGNALDIVEQLSTYIGYSNSSLNPFLYVIVGKQFKQRARDVLRAASCKRWERSRSGYSSGNVTSRQYESTKI
ncbi:hypothetical protein WMY93_032179 [Mugilogobius chulae]|uniref:G-protein coupled receptors family 1 profile domain-containing protein n=1 Tax=Mugilogobius chulae TaxID=88201 RepID=A0AAW0MGM4_9GOBI